MLRADRGRLSSAEVARVQDLQLAEDALQEAAASALVHWSRGEVPARPDGWLIRVAFRKAIDAMRTRARGAARDAALTLLARDEVEKDPEAIADEQLRLLFICCHPALEPKTRVALTLRVVAGLPTGEIARAFPDHEPAMTQRLNGPRRKSLPPGSAFPFQSRRNGRFGWDRC